MKNLKTNLLSNVRGLGIRVQIGRSHLQVQAYPFDWEQQTSLMSPQQYGAGVWITRNHWA